MMNQTTTNAATGNTINTRNTNTNTNTLAFRRTGNNSNNVNDHYKKRLSYKKMNNSNDVLVIDLLNGYSVMSISGWDNVEKNYKVTLFLRENTIENWELIEDAENLVIDADYRSIHIAILKQVGSFLDSGFFDYYIQRYNYEMGVNDYTYVEQG